MKCPVDGATLVMTERSGVEIDYCPQCRGVWLDRGELDKILEKAAPAVALPEPGRGAPPPQPAYGQPRSRAMGNRPTGNRRRPPTGQPPRDAYRGHDDDYYKKKKRKSLLDDIFDF
jgi:Zn-finger nucleic acid-binding protein